MSDIGGGRGPRVMAVGSARNGVNDATVRQRSPSDRTSLQSATSKGSATKPSLASMGCQSCHFENPSTPVNGHRLPDRSGLKSAKSRPIQSRCGAQKHRLRTAQSAQSQPITSNTSRTVWSRGNCASLHPARFISPLMANIRAGAFVRCKAPSG
jgi:hypothetical protein